MTTHSFRLPQFSEDAAYLPPWLQFDQSSSPTTSFLRDNDNFPQFYQNGESFKGDGNPAKDSNVLLMGESKHEPPNIFRLYLSGEDSLPNTVSPSEKVLHFNLHLSTDGTSSTWDTSQNEMLNSPDDNANINTLQNPRVTSTSNMNFNGFDVNRCPPDENCSGNIREKILNKPKNSGPDNVETFDTKGTECNDIDDAVELSVAASEALVIHDIIRSESIPEAMSAAAVLEVALRVKQARLDESQDSGSCFKDSDNTSDILSDLSDSDLEDVYNDVGLSIGSLNNILSMDPSVSRVKDTPMTLVDTEDEREVQSEWNQHEETYLKNSLTGRPFENNPDKDKSKDLLNGSFDFEKHKMASRNSTFDSTPQISCHQGNENLENMQTSEGYSDGRTDDRSPHRKLNNSPLQLPSGETNFKRKSGESSFGYQSRWLGGWGTKEGGVDGRKEPNGAKTISKMLINVGSYLSESTYVPSDQNSEVKCHQSCPNSWNVNKELDDSYKTSTKAVLSQDIVKDSNSSFVDPLCSIVPCSISSENGQSSVAFENCYNPRVINAVSSLEISTKVPVETVHRSSGDNGENTGRRDCTEQLSGDDCTNPIIRRQTVSLKEYSRGLLGNSSASLEKGFNFGLEEECNDALLDNIKKVTCNNSCNAEDIMKALNVGSNQDCATDKINAEREDMRLLTVDQHITCSNSLNELVPDKQPCFRSKTSCTIPADTEQRCFGESGERHYEDNCEGSDKKQAQTQIHMQDRSKSPLVLRHKARRFRAPRLREIDPPTAIQADEQVCKSKNVCQKSKVPQGQLHGIPNTENSARKRIRFSDADIKTHSNKSLKRKPSFKTSSRVRNKLEPIYEEQGITSQEVKERLTKCRLNGRKKLVFQGLDFLLTGFSKKKAQEIERLLRKNGGMVLPDIPTAIPRLRERSSSRSNAERLPVVICSRKSQTTTFLYGCAVNAFLLKAGWAYDSVKAGSVLPPDKYQVLSLPTHKSLNKIGKSIGPNDINYIFCKVGIMLHGTHSFCTKLAKVIKHGRGLVYKSLQWLVQSLDKKKIFLGVIVVENDNQATRHLKKYASEQSIPVMPESWIVNSLLEGKLLTAQDNLQSPQPPATEVPEVSVFQDWSQEI